MGQKDLLSINTATKKGEEEVLCLKEAGEGNAEEEESAEEEAPPPLKRAMKANPRKRVVRRRGMDEEDGGGENEREVQGAMAGQIIVSIVMYSHVYPCDT